MKQHPPPKPHQQLVGATVGTVRLAHPAGPKSEADLVRTKVSARGEGHKDCRGLNSRHRPKGDGD